MATKKSVHFSKVPNDIKYYKEYPIHIDISNNCNYNSLRPPREQTSIVHQQQIVQQKPMQYPVYYHMHPMSTPINIPINVENVPLVTTFTFFYPTKLQCNVIDVRIIIHENVIRIALHYNHRYIHHFDYRHRNGIIYNRNIT
jgi:hypothetical protein